MPLTLPRGVKGRVEAGAVTQNQGVDCVVKAAFVFGGWSRSALAMMTFSRSACRSGSIGGGSPASAAPRRPSAQDQATEQCVRCGRASQPGGRAAPPIAQSGVAQVALPSGVRVVSGQDHGVENLIHTPSSIASLFAKWL